MFLRSFNTQGLVFLGVFLSGFTFLYGNLRLAQIGVTAPRLIFGTGANGQNTGFLFIHFKHEKRPHATAIVADMQKQFAQIPGFSVFLQPPPLLTLGQNVKQRIADLARDLPIGVDLNLVADPGFASRHRPFACRSADGFPEDPHGVDAPVSG